MGSFHLTKMALRNLVKKPATQLYPIELPAYTPMTKGRITNDITVCILCGTCERKCPATALRVNKDAGTWVINPFSCVQCNTCVRLCPKGCLAMEQQYTAPSAIMELITLTKPEPTPEELDEKAAKDKAKAERLAAIKAKKAAQAE
jgi:formate hydrogenlyase subunit 6/NADH:ubiquinone oxidoreductase subunit I